MRGRDRDKPAFGKAAKTINFDKDLLRRLEELADKENTTVSNIVNSFMRPKVMNDPDWYREMGRYYYIKFQECKFLEEQADVNKEAKR